MLNLLCVDLVILRVRAKKPDISQLKFVPNSHNQPIGVSLDVEHDTIISKNASCPVFGFDVLGAFPSSLLHLGIPCPQRTLCIRMFLPEEFERFQRNDPHDTAYLVPNLGTSPGTQSNAVGSRLTMASPSRLFPMPGRAGLDGQKGESKTGYRKDKRP